MSKKIIAFGVLIVMIFSIVGCTDKDFLEVETDNMIELHTWFFTSGLQNNAILLKHSDKNAVFECSVDKGEFFFGNPPYNIKNTITKPDDVLYWRAEINGTLQAFIDIILKLDDNIIGYAIIKIEQGNSPVEHTAQILKAVLFPKINEVYQNITDEQVNQLLNKQNKIREILLS